MMQIIINLRCGSNEDKEQVNTAESPCEQFLCGFREASQKKSHG